MVLGLANLRYFVFWVAIFRVLLMVRVLGWGYVNFLEMLGVKEVIGWRVVILVYLFEF
jgi:hypothetical protein